MKRTYKTAIIAILILTVFSMATPAMAQDAGKKLGRGFVNAISGWLEIPKGIYDESKETNVLVGLTLGTLKGAGHCIVRTVTGAYEVATFPFPIPANYEQIITPEYVFSQE